MSRAVKMHVSLAIMWALLLIPTLIWWKESILWVATMSLYANFVGHLSSYEAAKSAGLEQKDRDLLNEILKEVRK